MRLLFLLSACHRSSVVSPEGDVRSIDAPVEDTAGDALWKPTRGPAVVSLVPLDGCDVRDVPIRAVSKSVLAASVRSGIVFGEPSSLLGASSVILPDSAAGSALAIGAIGQNRFGPYVDTARGASWIFRSPLAGERYWTDAEAVMFGRDGEKPGLWSAQGDFTGDGVSDLVVGTWSYHNPQWVVAFPPPPGFSELADVAVAEFPGDASEGPHNLSAGDWNGDGVDDLGLAYSRTEPFGFPDGGLLIYFGPLSGTYHLSNLQPLPDAAVTGNGLDDPKLVYYHSGMFSALIPDANGDGAADALASGEFWSPEIAPYAGTWGGQQGGYALFDGNVPLGRDVDQSRSVLYGVCDSALGKPVPVGDVTGDGAPDVAVVGRQAMVGGVNRGAVYVLSQLMEAEGTQSITSAAGAVIAGHGPMGMIGGYFYSVAGLGDLNGDGVGDLAISDTSTAYEQVVYVLLGPVLGTRDIGEADLAIYGSYPNDVLFGVSVTGGGDLDGDGVPDLVVNDYLASYNGLSAGAVSVLSGGAILSAIDQAP